MKIKCPKCNKQLGIPEKLAGQVVKCPCGQLLQTQRPSRVSQVSQSGDTQAANLNVMPCPDCGATVSRNALACPRCASPLTQQQTRILPRTQIKTNPQLRQQSHPKHSDKKTTGNKTLLWCLGGCGGCLSVIVVLVIVYFSLATYVYVNDIDLFAAEDSLPKGLSTNKIAEHLNGTWVAVDDPKILPNGNKIPGNRFETTLVYNPDDKVHGEYFHSYTIYKDDGTKETHDNGHGYKWVINEVEPYVSETTGRAVDGYYSAYGTIIPPERTRPLSPAQEALIREVENSGLSKMVNAITYIRIDKNSFWSLSGLTGGEYTRKATSNSGHLIPSTNSVTSTNQPTNQQANSTATNTDLPEQNYLCQVQISRFKVASLNHFFAKKKFPSSIDELKPFLKEKQIPLDPWGNAYRCQLDTEKDQVTISSSGPDSQFDTADDVSGTRINPNNEVIDNETTNQQSSSTKKRQNKSLPKLVTGGWNHPPTANELGIKEQDHQRRRTELYYLAKAAIRYAKDKQHYPSYIEELKPYLDSGYNKTIPFDPWGNDYRIEVNGAIGELVIWSVGPDGRDGTKDDDRTLLDNTGRIKKDRD